MKNELYFIAMVVFVGMLLVAVLAYVYNPGDTGDCRDTIYYTSGSTTTITCNSDQEMDVWPSYVKCLCN